MHYYNISYHIKIDSNNQLLRLRTITSSKTLSVLELLTLISKLDPEANNLTVINQLSTYKSIVDYDKSINEDNN